MGMSILGHGPEIAIAFLLDSLLGDPQWMPHPVRGIGWIIKKLEPYLRRCIRNDRIAGGGLAFSVAFGAFILSLALIQYASSYNRYLGLSLSIILIYFSLAAKDLKVEGIHVYKALEAHDIERARKQLSMIVGRDTRDLDEGQIIRATVETVSENTVDGVIAPLLYAFIGGAPLCLAYKAVNTLDSMVGYKDERYRNFGWASARMDDLANYIPARISLLFLTIASLIAGKDAVGCWNTAWRDGGKNPSPNSGIPEAAVAGALGIQLGGSNFYNSVSIQKPLIGEDLKPLAPRHIKEGIQIMYFCAALFLVTGLVLVWITGRR